jgi:hypothetical protein
MKAEKLSRFALGASALAAVAFVLVAGLIDARAGTWFDEACTMTTSRGPLGQTLSRALEMEAQPPLYFLGLNLWLRLRDTIGFARLLSTLFTLAACLVTFRAMTLAKGERPSIVATIALIPLFASPFVMNAATQARGYGLQLLIGAGLAFIGVRASQRGKSTWLEALGIAALGIAASYVHYVAGVASALLTVALLVSRVMPFKQAAAVAATGVVATLPLVGWVRQQVGIHAEPTEPDALEVLYAFPRFFIPHAVRREPIQDIVGFAVLAAIVVGLVLRYRRDKQSGLGVTRATWVLGLVTLMVLPFFALAGVLGGAAAVQLRYFAAFAPCVWIATWLLFESAVGGKVAAWVLGVLALGGAYRIAKIDLFDQRPGNWRVVAEAVADSRDGAIPVVAFPSTEALPLRVELATQQQVWGFPHHYDGSTFPGRDLFIEHDFEAARKRLFERVGTRPFWFARVKSPLMPAGIDQPFASAEDLLKHVAVTRRLDLDRTELYLVAFVEPITRAP